MSDTDAASRFAEIFDSTSRQALAFITAKCRNTDDIADILQETYLELYRVLEKRGAGYAINEKASVLHIAKQKISRYYSLLEMIAPIEEYGGGFDGEYSDWIGEDPIVLAPSSPVGFGVDGVGITGMGYIDGMLHIQAFPGNTWENGNHGYIYFKDGDGAGIQSVCSIVFNEWQNGERVQYNEFVFDIPRSRLGGCEAYGYFVTGGAITEGYWQVTFPLDASYPGLQEG